MSRNLPLFPTEITLDTLPQLFAAHRAVFGGMTMEGTDGGPQRPDDVSEEVWEALGDPGKQALAREREANADLARQNAQLQSQLAAAKARPAPPRQPANPPAPTSQQAQGSDAPDIGKLIADAVSEAIKPFQEQQQAAAAREAAQKVADAVTKAAEPLFHDKTDALGIDMTSVVNEHGEADPQKIQDALKALLTAKPHLGKVDGRRYPQPGSLAGAGGNTPPLQKQVQDQLALMQSGAGIRPAATT